MPFGSLLLAFVLMIMLPATGIFAGLLSWQAFRQPTPQWRMVGVAAAILVLPYIMVVMIAGLEGLELALSNHPLALISQFVAIGIAVAAFRARRASGGGR